MNYNEEQNSIIMMKLFLDRSISHIVLLIMKTDDEKGSTCFVLFKLFSVNFFRKSASLLNYFVKLATGVDIISSKHLRTGAPDLKKYNAFD